ncbi:AMIN-like domain-containing (lipo)protein [Arthrobacter sp. C152]
MKKIPVWFAAVLLALGLGILAPGPASAATPYCGLSWGSLAKSGQDTGTAQVTNVRTGQHYCFDRLVVDLNGPAVAYTVQYVPRIAQEGSGAPIPVRGGARLRISVTAPSYDQNGNPTYSPADRNELSNVSGYQTFRQVVSAGSFEGYTSLGLGVRARLPFRVFTLAGPGAGSRLVIDVAHYW